MKVAKQLTSSRSRCSSIHCGRGGSCSFDWNRVGEAAVVNRDKNVDVFSFDWVRGPVGETFSLPNIDGAFFGRLWVWGEGSVTTSGSDEDRLSILEEIRFEWSDITLGSAFLRISSLPL
jgi:hypothetical protein